VPTLRLAVDPADLDSAHSRDAIAAAARILRTGGLVALPTETVYGLGANALDPVAVARIFAAKLRPAWDPVIVHVADEQMVASLVSAIPDAACALMKAFWPGPLTLLLPRSSAVPDSVTAGRPLVGVRMPAHPVALEVIRQAGVPVAAPSANLFGHISPTTASHVLDDLDGRMDAVLDAGPTLHGVESTVLDPTRTPMLIYRPGAVTAAQILASSGPVEIFHSEELPAETPPQALPSPGVGLRHYAPKARLELIEAPTPELGRRLAAAALGFSGQLIGILLPEEIDLPAVAGTVVVRHWGRWSAPEEMAHDLYAGLRALDTVGCSIILCPVPPQDGVGAAIRDRLFKAARRAAET
jgi:L-threonylcarbamoyladenylate synthase